MQNNGFFISIEGIDGAGKTTQIKLLYQYLINNGYEVVLTKEPGGTSISNKIREIILSNDTETEVEKMFPETEALLFASARAQHVRQVIRPALQEGKIVLSDRFIDSSLAYQGELRGLGIEKVFKLNQFAVENTMPNLTICLSLPLSEVKNRFMAKSLDRIEKSFNEEYWSKILLANEKLSKKFPERFIIVDANRSIEEIHTEIIHIFEQNI